MQHRRRGPVLMGGAVTIALDAMGGDHAPQSVLRGAHIALERYPNTNFLLFGPESRVAPLLAKLPRVSKAAVLHHTSDMLAAEGKPAQGLRIGRGISMRRAIDAIAEGRADAVVSGGETGALTVIATFVLKTLPGIDRPAIAALLPTLRNMSVMLDLGANLECDAENLVQFAALGVAFSRSVRCVSDPVVGMLNVGSDEVKGNDIAGIAAARLRNSSVPIRFHGFVDGTDIAAGTVDVIVTDGFTGNVALKTMEGTLRFHAAALRSSFRRAPLARVGCILARGPLKQFTQRLDPRHYTGATLLGLRGIVVKSHGSADATAFANAIGVAIDMKANDFLGKIRSDLDIQRLA
jgi:glycerol-3-phosphate acyltransferase PlsX